MSTSFYASNVGNENHTDSRVMVEKGRGSIEDMSRYDHIKLQSGGFDYRGLASKMGLEGTRQKRGVPTTTEVAKQNAEI